MKIAPAKDKPTAGFTLVEVILSAFVVAIGMAGIFTGYLLIAKRVDWAAKNTAAQACILSAYERAMAAQWSPQKALDEFTTNNFPLQTVVVLAIPNTGTTPATATNYITITQTTNTPAMKVLKIECVWSLSTNLFTNRIVAFRAPSM